MVEVDKLGFNISYSTKKQYKDCQRQFYYYKISNVKPEGTVPSCYADAGKVVHEILELNKKGDYNEIRKDFNKLWTEYKLDTTNVDMLGRVLSIEKYWGAVITGLKRNYKTIKNEELYLFNDNGYKLKGFIDKIVDWEGGIGIVDWKTNSKTDEDQINQLKFYGYLYYRKYNRIPDICILDYIKINKKLEIKLTIDDIREVKKDIEKFIIEIKSKKSIEDYSYDLSKCYFCDFKKTCYRDRNKTEAIVTEEIMIEIKNSKIYFKSKLNKKIEKIITEFFSYEVENKYIIVKAVKRKNPTSKWDGEVNFYKNKTLPFGFINILYKLLMNYGVENKIKIKIKLLDSRKELIINEPIQEKLNNIELRDYQKEAVDSIMKKRVGIIKVPTGGGKTVIAGEIIRRLNTKTIFVVDKTILLDQTYKEFKNIIDIDIGMYGGGCLDLQNVTIMTIQTITSKLKKGDIDLINYLKDVNCVICDETHIATSKSYNEFFKKVINANYLIGLSGTPNLERNDWLELSKNIGDIVYEIKTNVLQKKEILMKPKIHFINYKHKKMLQGSYIDMFKQVLMDETRLNKIIELCKIYSKKSILILVNRIDYGNIILDLLKKNNITCKFIQGIMPKKDRDIVVDDLRNKKLNVVIGTASIVSTGLNIKSLEIILNTTAHISSIQTIQSLGRILRTNEGKEICTYLDLYDKQDYMEDHTKQRIKTFEEEGYEIIVE